MQQSNKILTVYIAFAVIIAIFFVSCKKYLDKKPDSSLTVPKTLDELQGLFNDAQLMNFQLTPSMPESSADDYFLSEATYNYLTTQTQDTYIWSLKDYKYPNDWSKNYLPVYNANFTLATLDKIPLTPINEKQWNNLKGEALFTRAYSFLNLVWEYSKGYDKNTSKTDLGIVLRLTSDFNVPSQRSSVQSTYQQIISDAEESIQLLPNLSANILLPSKAASFGLLARVFLSMREYDSAFEYSNLCLALKNDLLDYNDVDLTNNIPFTNFDNPEVIFYTEMNTYNSTHYSFRGFIDTTLFAMYKDDDLRKTGYFRIDNGYYRFKGSYTANSIYLFTGIATDEILLIRAECSARKGVLESAMNDLNRLMEKRWDNTIPYPTIAATNQDDAVNKILSERRKELLMRGIRWSDIKRLNLEGKNIIPTRYINGKIFSLPVNDGRYALPIPSDIITSTKMVQN